MVLTLKRVCDIIATNNNNNFNQRCQINKMKIQLIKIKYPIF